MTSNSIDLDEWDLFDEFKQAFLTKNIKISCRTQNSVLELIFIVTHADVYHLDTKHLPKGRHHPTRKKKLI